VVVVERFCPLVLFCPPIAHFVLFAPLPPQNRLKGGDSDNFENHCPTLSSYFNENATLALVSLRFCLLPAIAQLHSTNVALGFVSNHELMQIRFVFTKPHNNRESFVKVQNVEPFRLRFFWWK